MMYRSSLRAAPHSRIAQLGVLCLALLMACSSDDGSPAGSSTGGSSGAAGIGAGGGTSTGGTLAAGGTTTTGGTAGAGGAVAAGGTVATGGITGAGGMIATGGVVGSGGIGPGSGGVAGAGGMVLPPDPGPYPAGPYGNAVGNVLANLQLQGYVNPTCGVISTTLPFVDWSLDELRRTSARYALVHVSEFF